MCICQLPNGRRSKRGAACPPNYNSRCCVVGFGYYCGRPVKDERTLVAHLSSTFQQAPPHQIPGEPVRTESRLRTPCSTFDESPSANDNGHFNGHVRSLRLGHTCRFHTTLSTERNTPQLAPTAIIALDGKTAKTHFPFSGRWPCHSLFRSPAALVHDLWYGCSVWMVRHFLGADYRKMP